ncbi:MAG: hypothetical protein U9Q58_10850, partial [Pseudomonadota bacterium]|nr:hypothetical protein [Pseudomonadota bacterium]
MNWNHHNMASICLPFRSGDECFFTKTLEDLVNHSLLAGKVLIFVFSGRDKFFEIIRKVVNPGQMRIDYLFLDSETDLSSTLITLLRRLPSSYSVYDILYLEPG